MIFQQLRDFCWIMGKVAIWSQLCQITPSHNIRSPELEKMYSRKMCEFRNIFNPLSISPVLLITYCKLASVMMGQQLEEKSRRFNWIKLTTYATLSVTTVSSYFFSVFLANWLLKCWVGIMGDKLCRSNWIKSRWLYFTAAVVLYFVLCLANWLSVWQVNMDHKDK